MRILHLLLFAFLFAELTGPLLAQTLNYYNSFPVTGQLTLSTTVNVTQVANAQTASTSQAAARPRRGPIVEIHPSTRASESKLRSQRDQLRSASLMTSSLLPRALQATPVNSATTGSGFMGLTHYDQRNAYGGNQFSIEPPSEGLAVGNGFVVQGVNNAFQVYNTSGQPLLSAVLATNQVFGLSPEYNRATGLYGVYPTDIRVFYDETLNRFFVMQRSQDNDIFGDPLPSSHLYIAVSQTGDPTGTYNVYLMNTTNPSHSGCPCISDYPEIAADQFGIYITWNEYNASLDYVDVVALAISKSSLSSNSSTPTVIQFQIPYTTGFEFTIQPASTPPGGAYFVGDSGLEYFVSSNISGSDDHLAVWVMTNTSSLSTSSPDLQLIETIVPTELYESPGNASQPPGPTPLGGVGSPVELLDGGDTRIQSVEYVNAQLYVTLETLILDANQQYVIGTAYIVLSPIFRANTLNASVAGQGYVYVNNDHLLRPALAMNPQGQGAIVFTLVGPDYYPSAAFIPINGLSPGTAIQIAGLGVLPEDGFTGYPAYGGDYVARWGDYSAAVAASDGSIWMATEYIPNAPRTPLANWGTYIATYNPSN